MNDVALREFKISDWEDAWEIWEEELTETNDESWSKDKVEVFLNRNPGLSFVALIDGKLAGTVMGGFDGRRGYVYHLAVAGDNRRKGIGSALMKLAITKLKNVGASKIHLMIAIENQCGKAFYKKLGFQSRNDLSLMSIKRI